MTTGIKDLSHYKDKREYWWNKYFEYDRELRFADDHAARLKWRGMKVHASVQARYYDGVVSELVEPSINKEDRESINKFLGL